MKKSILAVSALLAVLSSTSVVYADDSTPPAPTGGCNVGSGSSTDGSSTTPSTDSGNTTSTDSDGSDSDSSGSN